MNILKFLKHAAFVIFMLPFTWVFMILILVAWDVLVLDITGIEVIPLKWLGFCLGIK